MDKKEYKKRTRRAFRSEMPLPNPDMYITSQPLPPSALSHPPSTPPPPSMVDFPTPTSPMMAPMHLQMHGLNGLRMDSSDEDGDDDADDAEFEDSEPTAAPATGTDVHVSVT